ncbi:MAG: UbiX family flavin prenyltransferase [Ancalomicrobiaceae bacterium]|nr:UbiX family flavin prenyltransferase [Ancalomicrobiaceae bacterium]
MKIVLAVTGASGAILARETLRQLKAAGASVHLVISHGAERTIPLELGPAALDALRGVADVVHAVDDMAAPIASGSYRVDAMAITPCSMRTLAAIAHGFGDNLITRAADVMLKERRRLVIAPREAPLTEAHLNSMLALTRMGAIVAPPVPPFYADLKTIDDVAREIAARTLSWLGLDPGDALTRWQGG